MKRSSFALAALFVCLPAAGARGQSPSQTHAQRDDPPRYEAGIQFSTITLTPSNGYRTEIGFGGRLTFNVNRNVALEAEASFFPNRGFSAEPRAAGRAFEGLFGVKAGRRWQKFGLFAKGRPGFISFSDGAPHYIVNGPNIDFRADRATHFATDVGGVLEFYVSRRLVTRFDVGDTIIRYGTQTTANPFPPPLNFTAPAATRHNLQVNAGIGFRF